MNVDGLKEGGPPRSSSRDRWINVLVACIVLATSVGIGEYIAGLQQEGELERERAETTQYLALFRARLEGEFTASFQLTRGMIAWIAARPHMSHDSFQTLAAELRLEGRHIRNLGLAPDNVLTFVYPLEGNEEAVGLVYADHPEQWPGVERAMRVGGTVVSGPLELVQGGTGLIARTPVNVRQGPDEPARYWGLASVVMDFPSLMEAAGASELLETHRLAIRGRDGRGASGEVFFGEASLFDDDPVLMDVELPNGSWQLALLPRTDGAPAGASEAMVTRLVTLLMGMLLAMLLVMLLRARSHARQLALQDALTGVPNLRFVRERIRRLAQRLEQGGEPFGIVVVDLDGFKEINDRHGHLVGDGVLVNVAARLAAGVRPMDTVARVGGDEFLVVLPGVRTHELLDTRCAAIRALLIKPMKVQGKTLHVGASVGGALCDQSVQSLDDAMRLADERMYAQKETGGYVRPTDPHAAPG